MRLRLATIMLLAMIAGGVWVGLNLRSKSKYDKAKAANQEIYAITLLNQQMNTFLAEVQSHWTSIADVTNGPDSEVIKLAGMTPSVRNLIDVFNYQMPPYRWFSPSQNRKAAERNLIKAKFMPISLDKRWHLSEDDHLAVLWCKTNVVYVYRDEAAGLRATLYVKKKNKTGSSVVGKENAP